MVKKCKSYKIGSDKIIRNVFQIHAFWRFLKQIFKDQLKKNICLNNVTNLEGLKTPVSSNFLW